MPVSIGTPLSSLRSTSALAASMRSQCWPYSLPRAATRPGWPPAGTRQSTEITGAPWLATAAANSGSPTLTTPTCCGSAVLAGCVMGSSAPALPRAAGQGPGNVEELSIGGCGRAPAGGGDQRFLGGQVGLAPATCLPGQRGGPGCDVPGHPADLVRRGTAQGGPAGHDLARVQYRGQVAAGQPQRLPGQFGRRGVQEAAVDVDAAQTGRARLAHRAADHPVRGAVVHPALLHHEL